MFLATAELAMHSVVRAPGVCVYLRAVCLTESWCVVCLYRSYFSLGWWIINEFVFELVSWSWRSAWRCLCLSPLHPSLLDLPASLLHSFLYFLLRMTGPGTARVPRTSMIVGCLLCDWAFSSDFCPCSNPVPSSIISLPDCGELAFICFPGWGIFFFSPVSLIGYSLSFVLLSVFFKCSMKASVSDFSWFQVKHSWNTISAIHVLSPASKKLSFLTSRFNPSAVFPPQTPTGPFLFYKLSWFQLGCLRCPLPI